MPAIDSGATSRPLTSCRTISRGPEAQSKVTQGTPAAIASCSPSGNPSAREVSAQMLARPHSLGMSVVLPGSSTRSQSPRLRVSRTRCGRWWPWPRIRSRQPGSWSATSAKASHQLGELLLHHQPAGRDDRPRVEQRARREALGQRVRHDHDLGRDRAELGAQPVRDARRQQRDHVGAGRVDQQRLHPRGPLRGRPVLLVDHHHRVGRQLDGAGQQRRRHRHQHVGRQAAEPLLEPDVGERGELLVPPLRHQHATGRACSSSS